MRLREGRTEMYLALLFISFEEVRGKLENSCVKNVSPDM